MLKVFISLLLLLSCRCFDSNSQKQNKLTNEITFSACVDGSDWIKIENFELSIEHHKFSKIGTHQTCAGAYFNKGGVIMIDETKILLSQLPKTVPIKQIEDFLVLQGRGRVTFDGKNRILIDDDDFSSADIYILTLKGK